VLQVAALNVITVGAYLLGAPKPETTFGFLFAAIVLLGGYVGVVWLFVVRPDALTWRELLRTGPLSGGKVATDILIGAVTMFVGVIVAGQLGKVVSDILGGTQAPNVVPTPTTGPDLLLALVGAALLVPIGEELFFRGYAVTAWLRDLGERTALIRGALFFAFIHIFNILVVPGDALDGLKQAILVVVVLTPVGLALAWLYLRRGLIASIAGHASYNLLLITLSSLAVHGTPPGFGR
jgi:membrane protease YdiL (CAAX protease family)